MMSSSQPIKLLVTIGFELQQTVIAKAGILEQGLQSSPTLAKLWQIPQRVLQQAHPRPVSTQSLRHMLQKV